MKIRADEHVARAIVDAVTEMALTDGWELSSVVEAGFAGASDVHWATQFAKDGGAAILSGDTDFHSKPAQVLAIQAAGLKVIILPNKWCNAVLRLKASHLLLGWKSIEDCLTTMKARQCFRTQYTFTDGGELHPIQMDFQRARQKLKKAERPGR